MQRWARPCGSASAPCPALRPYRTARCHGVWSPHGPRPPGPAGLSRERGAAARDTARLRSSERTSRFGAGARVTDLGSDPSQDSDGSRPCRLTRSTRDLWVPRNAGPGSLSLSLALRHRARSAEGPGRSCHPRANSGGRWHWAPMLSVTPPAGTCPLTRTAVTDSCQPGGQVRVSSPSFDHQWSTGGQTWTPAAGHGTGHGLTLNGKWRPPRISTCNKAARTISGAEGSAITCRNRSGCSRCRRSRCRCWGGEEYALRSCAQQARGVNISAALMDGGMGRDSYKTCRRSWGLGACIRDGNK